MILLRDKQFQTLDELLKFLLSLDPKTADWPKKTIYYRYVSKLLEYSLGTLQNTIFRQEGGPRVSLELFQQIQKVYAEKTESIRDNKKASEARLLLPKFKEWVQAVEESAVSAEGTGVTLGTLTLNKYEFDKGKWYIYRYEESRIRKIRVYFAPFKNGEAELSFEYGEGSVSKGQASFNENSSLLIIEDKADPVYMYAHYLLNLNITKSNVCSGQMSYKDIEQSQVVSAAVLFYNEIDNERNAQQSGLLPEYVEGSSSLYNDYFVAQKQFRLKSFSGQDFFDQESLKKFLKKKTRLIYDYRKLIGSYAIMYTAYGYHDSKFRNPDRLLITEGHGENVVLYTVLYGSNSGIYFRETPDMWSEKGFLYLILKPVTGPKNPKGPARQFVIELPEISQPKYLKAIIVSNSDSWLRSQLAILVRIENGKLPDDFSKEKFDEFFKAHHGNHQAYFYSGFFENK